MKEKLISVIIPTYNRANSIAEAILSVKNQTYPHVQIIVIDDGSSDKTAEIVGAFAGVEYYYQENKGQGAARNAGLIFAKGEYLASLDSDDIWQPDFLTKATECLEKHSLDFVFLNWISLNGKESFLDYWERVNVWRRYINEQDGDWFLIDSENLRRIFLAACPTPSSSLLLRRSSMVNWNEEIIVADDWLLLLEIVVAKPCRAAFTLSPHWLKRVFGDNIYDGRDILQVSENNVRDDCLMADCLYSRLGFAEKFIFRRRRTYNHLNYVYFNLKQKNFNKKVLHSMVSAFTLAPFGVYRYLAEIISGYVKKRLKLMPPEKIRTMKDFVE
ncbi:MAG: glycosyltransferase family 2 protein [Blastocatellia bacterium]|nr:glycosyltransferase family 2 protein [Blastocatellia bacterium]